MTQQTKVAISADFLGSFARLPQSVQGKVSKFVANFQRNPQASGINYEKIQNARDPNMRSVRIDQAWRGIVLKPEQGNLYMLLWVDKHDDAYTWAERHRCTINPATGALQVYETVTAEEVVPAGTPAAAKPSPGMFERLSDVDLVRLGVPQELVATVRVVRDEADLDRLEQALPLEAYEALFLVAAGDSVDRILAERETRVDQKIDTNDFEHALERIESQARFAVVENETELAAVLHASLAQWRIFLHPSQRRLVVGRRSGPVRVLGGAGTGKTVVAMHRAKWLAEQWLPEGKKVLFTTFTRNLSVDIQANLRELCPPETLTRIEVINLDAWVRQYLHRRHYDHEICYGIQDDLWQRAMAVKSAGVTLPDLFFREEWQRVVQAQGVESLEDYKHVSRLGRGTVLSRPLRAAVWPVFEEYRSQLARSKKKEVDDAYRDAAALLAQDQSSLPYAAVVVDEAQDMGPQAFRLIRALVAHGDNDLFVVGDGHQRIYGKNKVVLSKCGIDIRGRSRKLRINYRTTEEIRRRAVALLEGCSVDDLDGGTDEQKGYRSLTHGEPPIEKNFRSADVQAAHLAELIRAKLESGISGAAMCVVARSNAEVEDIERRLNGLSIATHRIRVEEADAGKKDAVRLATMHRVKGLEFDEVFVASLNAGLVPPAGAKTDDPVEARMSETEERSLVYVALTRARKTAYLLSYGKASPLLGT